MNTTDTRSPEVLAAIATMTPRQLSRIALELRQTASEARRVHACAFADRLTVSAVDFARHACKADNFTRQG